MAKKKNNPWYGRIAVLAAVLVVLVAVLIGLSIGGSDDQVNTTVLLDAEAGIGLQLDKAQKVVKAEGLNEAGTSILAQLELQGLDADTAVNGIVDAMIDAGQLSDKANSILVSVAGSNAAKQQSAIAAKVEKAMADAGISGAVLSQTVSVDEKLEKLASENGITVGKAQLVSSLASLEEGREFAMLAKLSVHELNLILSASSGKTEIVVSGNPSEDAYIGMDAAKLAALEHAGENAANEATAVYIEMDCKDAVLCYEVTFRFGSYTYAYNIDARDGSVLTYDMQFDGVPSVTQPPVTVPTIPSAGYMDPRDALQYALDHAGAEFDQVGWLDVELDEKDENRPHYDCTFVFEGYEYAYEVHAVTGEILSTDIQDAPDRDDPMPTAPVFTDPPAAENIDKDTALAAALAHAGTSKEEAEVVQIKLISGGDGGSYVSDHYEIVFDWQSFRYAYHIDALDGSVLTYEMTETESGDTPNQDPEDDIGDDIYDDSDDFIGEDDDIIDGEFGDGEGGFDEGPADDGDYDEGPGDDHFDE